MCKFGFLRSFFGCCELRTAVIAIAMCEATFGLFEVVDFAIRHVSGEEGSNKIPKTFRNETISLSNIDFTLTQKHSDFSSAAFIIITIGCIDLLISLMLLYVAMCRKYSLTFVILIAFVWNLLMGFFNFAWFGVTFSRDLIIEACVFMISGVLELLCSYVIASYYFFVLSIIDHSNIDINMLDFDSGNPSNVGDVPSGIEIDESGDVCSMNYGDQDNTVFGDDSILVT